MTDLTSVEQERLDALIDSHPPLTELGELFAAAGHELALVGGPVRDGLMGRIGNDWDFTTSATPDQIEAITADWTDTSWDIGRDFGTIGLRKGDFHYEITTYRSDEYDPATRKPTVAFGDTLEADLSRRDFSINAMAIRLPSREFVDIFGGLDDLADWIIDTPKSAEQSFSDDPLRMMRAARFVSQLRFECSDAVKKAMSDMAERITIVSAERIRDELNKTLLGADPVAGLRVLVNSGLADQVLPELPAMKLERDEHHRHKDVYEHSLTVLEQAIDMEHRLEQKPDLTIRLAALLHDIGKPKTRRFLDDGTVTFHHHDVVGAKMTRKRMKALRYPTETIDQVSTLVELHLRFHGYGTGQWSDAAVRRYVRDAGDQLSRLHVLTRADCTTRNQRKALRLQKSYDNLELRIAELQKREELDSIRPDLDGNQIMEILGVGPGREVGEAYRFLMDLRMDRGPLGEESAAEALKAWWAARD